jgi:translation elongation factor EF-4
VKLTTIIPSEYMSTVMALCNERRGVQGNVTSIDEDRMLIVFRIPLAEIVVDFFEQLKFRTSGYASMDYEDDGYDETDLAKVTVSINGRPIDEFSMITPMAMARDRAKLIVRRLKREIHQQQYDVDIKATVGGKVVAGTLIHAMRKDFTQLLKGNMDKSRLKKKLAHQVKGKKRMKELGRIQIPKEAFINVLREND